METKEKQSPKQVDKDEGKNNNKVKCQTIIAERKERFETSMSGVAIVTDCKQFPIIHDHSRWLPFAERSDQPTLPLSLSEETEPALFNETFCSRCAEGRSKTQGKTRSESNRQEEMHHKICSTDFKQVNLNIDDTRMVNGLLTTTLCSTEL